MLKIATFNRELWNLSSFEKVSYDKYNKVFIVHLFDGSQAEFFDVEEKLVFQFVISEQKEAFLNTVLYKNYPYIQHKTRVPKSS
ncbi:hypothetical protein [Aquibacillus albus]|uniref:KTSC domain-containing protein n=1 Tax=Aquibacillus albus TaxID=1168171 RepID=A0ABS2MUQ6_9BACI|nr:hypothetical protein [Aquibacillus albus]MBM7569578.1 hypothetical protein [Aquibacillus albus]